MDKQDREIATSCHIRERDLGDDKVLDGCHLKRRY